MRISTILLAGSILLLGFIGFSPAQAADPLTKEDVQKIVADYLGENPEAIIDSLEKYRTQQETDFRNNAKKNVEKNLEWMVRKDAPSVGAADADVTVVEFFDYNCGYCRKAFSDIQDLIKDDKNVRFVFHEMPILSDQSHEIALWSLAAHKQGKYFEFHSAVMDNKGSRTLKTIKKLAAGVGLDVDQLEKDAKSDAVAEELKKSLEVARDIGIRGTPAFVIGGELYPGYLGEEGLKQTIAATRQKK